MRSSIGGSFSRCRPVTSTAASSPLDDGAEWSVPIESGGPLTDYLAPSDDVTAATVRSDRHLAGPFVGPSAIRRWRLPGSATSLVLQNRAATESPTPRRCCASDQFASSVGPSIRRWRVLVHEPDCVMSRAPGRVAGRRASANTLRVPRFGRGSYRRRIGTQGRFVAVQAVRR
jgi:hypothetical protein